MGEAFEARLVRLETHYAYQDEKIDKLNTQISTLNVEINTLNKLLSNARGGVWVVASLFAVLVFFGVSGKTILNLLLAK